MTSGAHSPQPEHVPQRVHFKLNRSAMLRLAGSSGIPSTARARALILARPSHSKRSRVITDRFYDWALHPIDRAVHSPSQDAPRGPSDRRTRDPDVAAQPAVQSRQTVPGASSLSDSLQPLVRIGWAPACAKGVPKHRLAKCRLSGLCRLHADSPIQEKPGSSDRAGNARVCCPDVR
jgi:hypothetical protein